MNREDTMNVGIVGLGLIGGSMAKSVKARTAHTVWGADLDQETMALARMSGAMDGPLKRGPKNQEPLFICKLYAKDL